MELFKCLFGAVVVLACAVTTQCHNTVLLPAQLPQQPKVPPPEAPFDKCQVGEREKIRCGTPDITVEQCENINCCFDGKQCYYGNAGICAL